MIYLCHWSYDVLCYLLNINYDAKDCMKIILQHIIYYTNFYVLIWYNMCKMVMLTKINVILFIITNKIKI